MENSNLKKQKILVDMSNTGYGMTGIQQDLRLVLEAIAQNPNFKISLFWYDVMGHFSMYNFVKTWFKNVPARISYSSQFLSALLGNDNKLMTVLGSHRLYKATQFALYLKYIYVKKNFYLYKLEQKYNQLIFKNFLLSGLGPKMRETVNSLDIFLVPLTHLSYYLRLIRSENSKGISIDTKDFDVALFPTETPINVSNNTFKVIRFYDLIPILNPDIVGGGADKSLYQYRAIKRCIEQNSFFVSISKTVQDELVEMFPELKNRVAYIEPAVGLNFKPSENPKKGINRLIKIRFCTRIGFRSKEITQVLKRFFATPDYDYILHVGTIEPRKNLVNLIKAYNRFLSKRDENSKPVKLILVGQLGWLYENILKEAKPLIKNGDIVLLEGATNAELVDLYTHAKVFSWLSFAEGWGMPPLEAMACGCNVISSDIPVHREAQGDASIYVDPYDISDIANAFTFATNPINQAYMDELKTKGFIQSAKFSGENMAKKWAQFFNALFRERQNH